MASIPSDRSSISEWSGTNSTAELEYINNSSRKDDSIAMATQLTELLRHEVNGYLSTLSAPVPPLDTFPSYEGWGLLISVEGIEFNYQFTREDLSIVFQRYGRLSGVDTLAPEYPFGRVWFVKKGDALNAIHDLDQKVLNGIHGRLRVVWDPRSVQRISQEEQIAKSSGNNNFSHMTSSPSSNLMPQPSIGLSTSSASLNISQSPNPPSIANRGISNLTMASSGSVRKYTCRIDINIENEKDFQVARRIIGTKGCNMKRIVDVSGAKLRLRGKGSGYLEGPNQTESPEPLHLCISCTTEKGYNEALKAATEILESVYAEYRKHLQYRKKKNSRDNITVPELKVVVQEMPLASSLTGGNGGNPIVGGPNGTSAFGSMNPHDESSFEYPSSPEIHPALIPSAAVAAATTEKRYDSGYWKVPS